MTQKQVELQKLILMEQEREKERTIDNSGESVNNTKENNELSFIRNNEFFRKRAKPGYLLKRKRSQKRKKKYSSTKVKARNFLTNISYTGMKNRL